MRLGEYIGRRIDEALDAAAAHRREVHGSEDGAPVHEPVRALLEDVKRNLENYIREAAEE
jgi:hypothetical protein